ncbi:MAG: hypothetical protein ACRD2D_06135 [Terriglobales bacterium]
MRTRDAAGKSYVAIVRVDGGTPQVAAAPVAAGDLNGPYRWTRDGRAVTYLLRSGSVANLWAAPLAGGKPYALTHFKDLGIQGYAFAEDGRLAISRGSPNRDAVLATGLSGKH